jgi:demethylmenaquinone methyltransferase/2-methoxy-6-polyprenyl-1,4-benzoquinol methylase
LIAQPLKQTARRIFGGLYSSYDWVLDYFTLFQDRYWKRWLLARASLSSDDLVLDIGCGTGVLEEKFAPDANVVGIDLSDEMLEIARSKHLSGFNALILGDAERLPFSSGSFDKVLSCYAVKYCDLNKFVAQTFRVLKPGGRLVIYDFARPRGLLGPLHFFYIYGVFRLLGLLTKRYDTGMSITFSELPQIIARTHWFEELGLALQNEGFEGCSNRFLSGGGVAIFWARKPCNRSEL